MKIQKSAKLLAWALTALLAVGVPCLVLAKEDTQVIDADVYEVAGDDWEYTFEDQPKADISPLGEFTISGDFSRKEIPEGVPSFLVHDGDLSFNYIPAIQAFVKNGEMWSVSNDGKKTVGGNKIKEKIGRGSILLLSSFDRKEWSVDKVITDIFEDVSSLKNPFSATVNIQLQTGCYYRVLVAYKLQRKVADHFLGIGNNEFTQRVEVYEFYAYSETPSIKITDKPRQLFNDRTEYVFTADKGYSGSKEKTGDDPHFGWGLGTFVINGYTRDCKADDGTLVFLKNVGDKVTLWFSLEQDINKLNGKEGLIITEDGKGYDQELQVQETDFGKGALIIRFTDKEGQKKEPIVYTNFLEAYTRTGADTKVQLFEEGDYEVALDYKIKKGGKKYNYRLSFNFIIRNGNCMVFPFDTKTGGELSDNAVTADGFKLDLAKSRYLDIDVEYHVINKTKDGTYSTDKRYSRPAADGAEYSEEGIYVFTVSNKYTQDETTKRIFVGTDPVLKAMAKNGWTEKEIQKVNEKLSSGAQLNDDGTFGS